MIPEARYLGGAAYMPTHSTVVLYGGSSSAGPRNDTWLLTYD